MSLLQSIMSKVFGSDHPAAQSGSKSTAPADTSASPPTTSAEEKTQKSNTWQDAPTNETAGAPPSQSVDVEAILDAAAAKTGQNLDWRHSIVDLLKALNLDSSHAARKELASELHYTGSTEDSAAMNLWLHREVIKKFTDNGGKLPADLH